MHNLIKIKSGIYILEIEAKNNFQLGIKKYGEEVFPKGYYYYVGSAQKSFYHRIKRHLQKTKNIHWHIDYLLDIPTNNIKTIFAIRNKSKSFECKVVSELESNDNLQHLIKGFGNSDCRTCKSHILYSKKKISHNHFISLYQSIARFIPSSNDISCR